MIKYIISAFFIYFLLGLMFFLFQRKILFNISGKPNKPENYELKNIKEIDGLLIKHQNIIIPIGKIIITNGDVLIPIRKNNI